VKTLCARECARVDAQFTFTFVLSAHTARVLRTR
jgi:hypothetical protein